MSRALALLLLPAAASGLFESFNPYALSPFHQHVLPAHWHDDLGGALRRMESRAQAARMVRGLMGELGSALSRLEQLEGELDVSSDDAGGVTVRVAGMTDTTVEVDDNILKISGTAAADGETTIRRALTLPRRVAEPSLIGASVEEGKLVIKVPRDALEPAPQRVQAKIDVKGAPALAGKAAAADKGEA